MSTVEVCQKEKVDVPLYFTPTLSHSGVLLIISTHRPREWMQKFIHTTHSQISEYKGYVGHISTGNLVTQVYNPWVLPYNLWLWSWVIKDRSQLRTLWRCRGLHLQLCFSLHSRIFWDWIPISLFLPFLCHFAPSGLIYIMTELLQQLSKRV